MVAKRLSGIRNLIALEDLLLGTETQEQTRDNETVTVTEINASLFPFDDENTAQDILDFLNIYADDVEFIAENIDNILAITDDVLEAQELLDESQILLAEMQAIVDELDQIDAVILNAFMVDVLAGIEGESFYIDNSGSPEAKWSELKFTPQSLSYDTTIPDNKNGVFYGDLVLEVDVDITFGVNSNLILVG